MARSIDVAIGAVPRPATQTRAFQRLPALITMIFGIIVIFSVGFLQTPAVHNGTHDTRHANGLPCH